MALTAKRVRFVGIFIFNFKKGREGKGREEKVKVEPFYSMFKGESKVREGDGGERLSG